MLAKSWPMFTRKTILCRAYVQAGRGILSHRGNACALTSAIGERSSKPAPPSAIVLSTVADEKEPSLFSSCDMRISRTGQLSFAFPRAHSRRSSASGARFTTRPEINSSTRHRTERPDELTSSAACELVGCRRRRVHARRRRPRAAPSSSAAASAQPALQRSARRASPLQPSFDKSLTSVESI